ncbi:hypothetical protein [Marinicellulosiphila megalodicopiae]|uniref:hypothetical protein n=1 Tax=Marinicellulosiphila megalodicopiae TaxID=2724896 RepID=UPI003BB09C89
MKLIFTSPINILNNKKVLTDPDFLKHFNEVSFKQETSIDLMSKAYIENNDLKGLSEGHLGLRYDAESNVVNLMVPYDLPRDFTDVQIQTLGQNLLTQFNTLLGPKFSQELNDNIQMELEYPIEELSFFKVNMDDL